MKSCHSDQTSGHLGIKKTIARICDRFMWQGIIKDVKEFVSSLSMCTYSTRLFNYGFVNC